MTLSTFFLDRDASIYGSNNGSLLMAWAVAGKVGGRSKHGYAGPRVVALEVKMPGLWSMVKNVRVRGAAGFVRVVLPGPRNAGSLDGARL